MTDPFIAALTGPGAPHELEDIVVAGVPMRAFRNGPKTLADLYRAATAHGAREFLVDGDQRLTFDAFFGLARAMAAVLRDQLGDIGGKHVAITMRNRAEWMVHSSPSPRWAAWRCWLTAVAAGPKWRRRSPIPNASS